MAALRYDSSVLDKYYAPISKDVERRLSRPFQPSRPFDLNHPFAWPHKPWVDFVNIAKGEFEVDVDGFL